MSPVAPDRALFSRYPHLVTQLPFIKLGQLPTPVSRLDALQRELRPHLDDGHLWVKRDDISAADYGGNKIRKLEFLLAEAKQQGCSSVLTFGGLGSNHALATSLNCRRLGLHCIAILTPEPATAAVRRTLLYHQLLGTQIEVATRYALAREIADEARKDRGPDAVYEIPFGGSSWMGATGFVNAAFELADQVATGQCPEPDVIYLGCGTAGSTAGLALGLQLAGLKSRIEAIQVTPDSIQPARLYQTLFEETAAELQRLDPAITLQGLDVAAVKVRGDQLGEGYAIPTPAAREAAELAERNEQMPVSLTYTAKALAALIADARAGLLAGKRVLFWNTYNSRPYPPLPDDDGWKGLPESLHALFNNQALF